MLGAGRSGGGEERTEGGAKRAFHAGSMTQRFLITGANGQLGQELVGVFGQSERDDVVGADRRALDVTDRDQVLGVFEELRPDVVIHAAAYTAVDACETDPDLAFATNAIGTRNVCEGARRTGAHVVYISSDYVFDGEAGRPYVEWDTPNPISVYGRSKLAGEVEVDPGHTVIRTSWVCGANGPNFVATMVRLAGGDGPVRVVDDQWGSPTFTYDLAVAVKRLATDRRPGVWHVTNGGETTWARLAREVFEAAGADPTRVKPITTEELDPKRPAERPKRSTLDNMAMRIAGLPALPPWQESLPLLVRTLVG